MEPKIERSVIVNKPILEQVNAEHKEYIVLNVKRYTTDANGTILDDAAIPASLKKPFPFHLFGEFDRNGGYAIADRITLNQYGSILFGVYVWGINTPLFFPNPLATVNNEFQKGDMLFVYVDDINNPNYFVFIVISSQNGPYASLIGQLNTTQLDKNKWGTFKIFDIQYGWTSDTQLQLGQPIFTILTEWNANFLSNPINPKSYYRPDLKPGVNELIIPINAVANQHFGLSSYLTYNNPLLILSLVIYV